jgi:glycosyltransferase involved in cell wall biosynthesis
VFNEIKTFKHVLDKIINLNIENINKEIIIIESNSTDGTREDVLQYKNKPDIKIIFENKPLGKGHAVRAGLSIATGDCIIIQDADLEYDPNDYHKLLAPLVNGQAEFVLGTRMANGSKNWQLRKFKKEKFFEYCLNLGHIFFNILFNLTYGQKLTDPFTMFKVFKRSCIDNISFTANRFDFDWELVGKLCRKGYKPLEIPIKYKSRSYKDGKKVSLLKDPILFFIANFKYRFCKI